MPASSVLLVEDDEDFAALVARGLERAGFRVHACGDAEAALELADDIKVDVALVDIGLPGADGYTLASALRARPDIEGLWVIAVTGRDTDADRKRAQSAGMDMFLTKPVDVDDLAEILRALPAPV